MVQALCEALGVTYDQLMNQPPPEVLPPGTPPQARSVDTPPQSRQRPSRALFPRDGRILRFLRGAADPDSGEAWLASEAATDQFSVRAIGDCLAPHVQDRDVLVLDLDRAPRVGDVVVVAVHGELHIKMVMQTASARLYLTSTRGELTLPEEGVELLGVVSEITRRVAPMGADMSNPGPAADARKPRLVKTMPPPWTANGDNDD